MKLRFVKLVCVAILWLCFTAVDAQPFHRLTVDDFQGLPSALNGETVAYTNCSIEYSYVAKRERDYYLLTFNIRMTINHDKSWVDKGRLRSAEMMDEILKHEQGHYNIAYIEQQDLLTTVSKTVFYADYERVARNIFTKIDAKYQRLNLEYDNDTEHSVNRVQQHSWDMYFKKRLETEYLAQN